MSVPTPALARPHYPALDGLRGIAILLVVCFHNFDFIDYFYFGWLGVDLFFVLSGFLITEILLRTVDRPYYFKRFYTRRILRIFPLYYFILIVFLIILPAFSLGTEELQYFRNHQIWLWTYTQNWLFATHDLGKSNILFHLWSLAVEEQYYLLWPFLVYWIRNINWLMYVSLALLLTIIIVRFGLWNQRLPDFNYFSAFTFTRMDGIFIGSLLALIRYKSGSFVENNTALIVLAVALLNFSFYFFNRASSFGFPYFPVVGYTTFAVVFGLLVNEAASENRSVVKTLLSWPALRFFGRISYGFYLFHWPIHRLLADPIREHISVVLPKYHSLTLVMASLLTTGIALLISIASFRYFESYFLGLKNRVSVS